MIKGILYSLALLLSLFLIMALLEYFGYFPSTVRAILFWFYLLAVVIILGYYVLLPLSKMFRMGKVISYEEAAVIIGNHFPEIKDKLLNLLQLQQLQQKVDDSFLSTKLLILNPIKSILNMQPSRWLSSFCFYWSPLPFSPLLLTELPIIILILSVLPRSLL